MRNYSYFLNTRPICYVSELVEGDKVAFNYGSHELLYVGEIRGGYADNDEGSGGVCDTVSSDSLGYLSGGG